MCDIGIALTLGASLLGGVGQMQAAKAQSAADLENSKMAALNAQLSEKQAQDAITRGQQDEQQKRMQTAQLMGKQRAAMAANGVDIGFGSPLDTLVDTAKMGEVDALNIRSNAQREAANDYTQAESYNLNADADIKKSSADKSGGMIGAIGTVLGGAGKAFSTFKTA